MDQEDHEFVTLLTEAQPALYARILSLLADRVAAQDVLQETNLTLWDKSAAYQPGTNFLAWASQIARYHALNYRRKKQRDRLMFSDDVVDELCRKQDERLTESNQMADALRECLRRLPPDQRELLEQRYRAGGSVQQLAAARGQTVGAVSQTLYRLRETLLRCVSQQRREHLT